VDKKILHRSDPTPVVYLTAHDTVDVFVTVIPHRSSMKIPGNVVPVERSRFNGQANDRSSPTTTVLANIHAGEYTIR
jgi:hypothetical protein